MTSGGGWPIIERIRAIVQPELGWDETRWEVEAQCYTELWQRHYTLPEGLPDATEAMAASLDERVFPSGYQKEPPVELRQLEPTHRFYLGLAFLMALVLGLLLNRRRNDSVE